MSLEFALQALLARHEAFMGEAEQGRQRMESQLAQLRHSEQALKQANAELCAENLRLHSEISTLRPRSINVRRSCNECDAAMVRLPGLEHEPTDLQQTAHRQFEEHNHAQLEMESIKDRVGECVRDMRSGRRATPTEQAKSNRPRSSQTVVSSFVKDILQDNARFQLNMLELRESLLAAEEEVDELHKQAQRHASIRVAAREEAQCPSSASSDVHVHHHYHTPKWDVVRKLRPSLPSSPLSVFQDQSIFDTAEDGEPGTPTSTQFWSPDLRSLMPETFSGTTQKAADEATAKVEIIDNIPFQMVRPRLHRAVSAESVLSVAHVDDGQYPNKLLGTSSGAASVEPITSATAALGRSSSISRHHDSRNYNRLLLAASNETARKREPLGMVRPSRLNRDVLGKKLGGWMSVKWGGPPEAVKPRRVPKAEDDKENAPENGKRLSTHVEAMAVDNSLLEEALQGG